MRTILPTALSILFLSAMMAGCAIGYDSMLFLTKSNFGIDVDAKPPTAEISVARREGVIGPTFEGGKKPPVLASFRSGTRGLLGLFASVSSTFAGGDAAATMTKLFGDPDSTQSEDATLCLSTKPSPKVLGQEIAFPGPGTVEPLVFGTDTSIGLKIAWSGLTAQFPDTVRLGYHRKEFALASVFGKEEACNTGEKYKVNVPSFLATLDSSATAKDVETSGLEHLQYFATGVAATNLALRQDVRRAMLRRLDPESAQKFESFASHQRVQIEAVRRIQAAYKAELRHDMREKIRQRATELSLIPQSTGDAEFSRVLSRAVDGNDPSVTEKLNVLESFMKKTG